MDHLKRSDNNVNVCCFSYVNNKFGDLVVALSEQVFAFIHSLSAASEKAKILCNISDWSLLTRYTQIFKNEER